MNEIQERTEQPTFQTWLKNPLLVGLLVGVLAAAVQGLLISAGGPEAYGFCVACHTRDLVNVAVNSIAGTSLAVAPISKNAILPVLTVLGILVGAFWAAKGNEEFRVKKGSISSYSWYAIGGILFMVFALIMGACPYRIALRVGYIDIVAIVGLIAIIIGVVIGTKIAVKMMEGSD